MSKFGESILRACINLAVSRPWAVVIVSLILTALASYAATGLRVNTSTEEILSSSLPFRQVEIDYRKAFPKEDLAVVVVDASTSDEAMAAAAALARRLRTSSRFESIELAGSSPYFDRIGLLFLEPDEIRELGNELRQARRLLVGLSEDPSLRGVADLLGLAAEGVRESAAPPSLAEMLTDLAATVDAKAEGKPAVMQWRSLLGLDGEDDSTRRLVVTKPVLDNTSINRAGAALDDLDAAIAATRAEHVDATFRVTGEPVLRQQELNDAFSGAAYASVLSFVLVALSLIIGIRSGRLIAALLITLVIGSIWTAGLAAVTIGRLNLISVAFLVLFFGLGVDFGTHLGLRHLEEARRGKPFKDALLTAMLGEGLPIVLSALCASLAFLAFVPTAYTGLAEFGIISALGMLVAVIVTFTVQPALMALMPPRPKPGADVTIGVGGWISRYHRLVLVLALVVTAGAAFYAPKARIDTNPLNLQDPSTEPVKTYLDLARDPDTTPYALDALVPNLEAARELVPKLEALPGVESVRYVEDFVPEDQPAKLEALAAARERVGESFMSAPSVKPPPNDAELAAAFAKAKTDAQEIAATPDDNPIDPAIKVAGRKLSDSLDRFAASRGVDAATLADLGVSLSSEMPGILAEFREKLSLTQPVGVSRRISAATGCRRTTGCGSRCARSTTSAPPRR
jgi:hopanoid biosynthesis associated RND transporter like protein HpnN